VRGIPEDSRIYKYKHPKVYSDDPIILHKTRHEPTENIEDVRN